MTLYDYNPAEEIIEYNGHRFVKVIKYYQWTSHTSVRFTCSNGRCKKREIPRWVIPRTSRCKSAVEKEASTASAEAVPQYAVAG